MQKTFINKNNLPQHIAIIMDGNGRWAKACGLPRIAGHREGVRTVRKLLKHVVNWMFKPSPYILFHQRTGSDL